MIPSAVRCERWAFAAVVACSVASIGQFVWLAVVSLGYPYQFEWMEGGMLLTIQRLRDGLPIYGAPSIDYVPYVYAPGYWLLTAAVSLVSGVSFFTARLVSFAAIVGVAAFIIRIVQREVGGRRGLAWAVIGAGLLCAMFPLSGRWYYLARVDSLFVLLLFPPFYLLRFRDGTASALWAGLLMTACFFTKQAAAVAFLAALGIVVVADPSLRRRGVMAGAVFVATTAAGVVLGDAVTGGWLSYYLLAVPARHGLEGSALLGFWREDLVWAAPLVCLTLAGGAALLVDAPRRGVFHAAVCAGFFLSAWSSRLHPGGWMNVLMPAFTGLALAAPIGLAHLERRLGSPARLVVALCLGLQFFYLADFTVPAAPLPEAMARGARFEAYVKALPGDVLLPDMDFIQRRAGKRDYALGMAARDLLALPEGDRGRVALEAALQTALTERRFAAIILSEPEHLRREILPAYCFKEEIDLAPVPWTGWDIWPRWVWVPRPAGLPPGQVACEPR